MKQQVLKALANPARIFYVPYTLAVINFVLQFLVFIVLFVIDVAIHINAGNFDSVVQPLYFFISVIVVHMILAAAAKRDPQLGQIVAAKIQLLRKKIPGRLVA